MIPIDEGGAIVTKTTNESRQEVAAAAAKRVDRQKRELWGRTARVFQEYIDRANALNGTQLPAADSAINSSDRAVRLAPLLRVTVEDETTFIPVLDYYAPTDGDRHTRQILALLPDGSVHNVEGNYLKMKSVSIPDKDGNRRELVKGISTDELVSEQNNDHIYINQKPITLSDGRKIKIETSRVGPDVPTGDYDSEQIHQSRLLSELQAQLDNTPPLAD